MLARCLGQSSATTGGSLQVDITLLIMYDIDRPKGGIATAVNSNVIELSSGIARLLNFPCSSVTDVHTGAVSRTSAPSIVASRFSEQAHPQMLSQLARRR